MVCFYLTFRWKYHEACMLVLGRIHSELEDEREAYPAVFNNFEQLFSIIIQDIKIDEFPFLQGRSLWLAAQFSEILSDALLQESALCSFQLITHCRDFRLIFGVKAAKQFFSSVPGRVSSFPSQIIPSICELASNAKDEFLFLLLETLTLIVKINPEQTASFEHLLGPLILNVWSKVTDGNTNVLTL